MRNGAEVGGGDGGPAAERLQPAGSVGVRRGPPSPPPTSAPFLIDTDHAADWLTSETTLNTAGTASWTTLPVRSGSRPPPRSPAGRAGSSRRSRADTVMTGNGRPSGPPAGIPGSLSLARLPRRGALPGGQLFSATGEHAGLRFDVAEDRPAHIPMELATDSAVHGATDPAISQPSARSTQPSARPPRRPARPSGQPLRRPASTAGRPGWPAARCASRRWRPPSRIG